LVFALSVVGLFVAIPRDEHDRTLESSKKPSAALAPEGWYLMMPPVAQDRSAGFHLDDNAPLARWVQWEGLGFETVAQCEKFKLWLEKNEVRVWNGKTFPFDGGKCVASDDPRLKEK
jgi:hypothetical protein